MCVINCKMIVSLCSISCLNIMFCILLIDISICSNVIHFHHPIVSGTFPSLITRSTILYTVCSLMLIWKYYKNNQDTICPQAKMRHQTHSSILSPFDLSIQLLSHASSFLLFFCSFITCRAQAVRQFGQACVHKNEQEIHWQWQVRSKHQASFHLFHSSVFSHLCFSLSVASLSSIRGVAV